jgi:hypothetical protein
MSSIFKTRYPGKRWTILYGAYEGVEAFALEEWQRALQMYQPYVLPVLPATTAGREHVAALGTAANNSLIAGLIADGLLAPPPGPEGFSLACLPAPWDAKAKLLVVAGADARGVLYGVEACNARLVSETIDRATLDQLAPFTLCEAPAVAHRGIWTWGYVIYDYRRFLDHMARLKLNTLTVWNDHVPLNAAAVLDYAHARGVRVVFGFHWGWGFGDKDITRAEDRAAITADVLQRYREQYAGLNHDGIYFQTLTEHPTQEMGGRSTASWACELVNDTAAALLNEFPGVDIQFGLHATSIGEHFTDLAALDPRVTITWEDAGALPFAYVPDPEGFDDTLAYAQRLAAFRPGSTFAMVPKGWMCLRWETEFENHGPFLLGERAPAYLHARLQARQAEWDTVNAAWLRHYPLAARFYRDILAVNPRVLATGLVEDGLFDEAIQPSVALFAETLWNPYLTDEALLARATRRYFSGDHHEGAVRTTENSIIP